MALIHADNFSIYGTTTTLMLNGVYAEATSTVLANDPDGVSSGYVLRNFNQTPGRLRYVLPSDRTTVGASLRVWLSRMPDYAGQQSLIEFRNAGNGQMIAICVTPVGRLQIRNAVIGTVYAETATPVITANGWYHLEVKVTPGLPGNCYVEIRIEGQVVYTSNVLTFANNSIAQVGMSWNGEGNPMPLCYYKDFVVWDTLGSRNNDWMGSVLVAGLAVTSDVALNWTPSTGANGYSILDNIPPVDAQYLAAPYSAVEPNFPSAYEGALSDLPIETTSVRGVITYVRAGKSDGGDGSLQAGIVSNPLVGSPVVGLGADRPITVAQTYWRDVFEVDPATTGLWTPSAVNRANIRINRTT